MSVRTRIAAAALFASAGLFAANVMAQPQAQPPAPQDGGSASPSQTQSGPGPLMGRENGGWGGRGIGPEGFNREMGRGGISRGPQAGMSEVDRTAFFEAHLASIKAGLLLNETQQRLWPAVEAALREARKQRENVRERVRKEGQPANPVDRMKRAGEMMTARGALMTKMADAMKPFHDSLSDDQKRRMQLLMRTGGGQRFGQQEGFSRNSPAHRWQRGDDDNSGGGRRWRQDAPGGNFGSGGNRGDWRRM